VALDGDRLLTWAINHDDNGDDSGAAYVFRRTTGGVLDKTWTLDPRGNWVSTTTNGVTQTRTHNAVNEITDISGDWADPAYDAAGNMASGPKGDEPAKRLHLVYDAWNRLAKVYDDDGITAGTFDANDTLRATYRYDGLHRRVRRIVVGFDGNSTPYDIYYGAGPAMSAAAGGVEWQRLEVRRFGDTVAYEQYLWGVRYIDSPVCRWHDADNDGTFEADANELHYYTNGANFNVTALLDANSGDVVERYLHDPYGRRTVLNGATDPDTGATEWHPDGDNRSDTDNPLGHQGLPHNDETAFLDNRMRPRCPGLGRWLQWDPNGYVDGVTLYEYVRCRPTVATDPRGLATWYWRDWRPSHNHVLSKLQEEDRKHSGALYYGPSGLQSLFGQLYGVVGDLAGAGRVPAFVGPHYGHWTNEVRYTSGAAMTPPVMVHEVVHALDDKRDWYLTAWPAREQAEALAYGAQHLLERVDASLQGFDLMWAHNQVIVGGKPIAAGIPERACDEIRTQWVNSWRALNGIFDDPVAWYGWGNVAWYGDRGTGATILPAKNWGFGELRRTVTSADLWDVNAKLGLRFSCAQLKAIYEKRLAERGIISSRFFGGKWPDPTKKIPEACKCRLPCPERLDPVFK